MIDQMGDKASAKATMKAAGVPTIPGSEGLLESLEEARTLALEVGYPVMLKATAGGGGKGMRAVWKEDELEKAWESARQEAKASFGNDGMYMEKLNRRTPTHRDTSRWVTLQERRVILSERDCSIQRRHQKLTEETPFSIYDSRSSRERKWEKLPSKPLNIIKYEGAGTIEFLVDKHRNFYFMEMNTRIQVEHPITEQVIDYDLICEQIKVACGREDYRKKLLPKPCTPLNAESMQRTPDNDFRPSPGVITTLHFPGGHGVRLDTHVYSGYVIPPHYDSMIAKLITTAQTREGAISKMKRALEEFVIEGVKTTIPISPKTDE